MPYTTDLLDPRVTPNKPNIEISHNKITTNSIPEIPRAECPRNQLNYRNLLGTRPLSIIIFMGCVQGPVVKSWIKLVPRPWELGP